MSRADALASAVVAVGAVLTLLTPSPSRADVQWSGGCDWCITNCQAASGNFCSNVSGSCGGGGGQCISGLCYGAYFGTYNYTIRCNARPPA